MENVTLQRVGYDAPAEIPKMRTRTYFQEAGQESLPLESLNFLIWGFRSLKTNRI